MDTGVEKFNRVVDYIEERLSEDISCACLARIAALSEYEFRRIFSFLAGIPVGEYIRRRRLSLAAEELKSGDCSVTDLALRYGYETASSFARAFKEVFGVTPQEARSEKVKIAVLTKFRFSLFVEGGAVMEYTEETLPAFRINGVSGESALSDTCCCESVWAKYECPEAGEVFAAYENGEENVVCHIGVKSKRGVEIDGGRWLRFEISGERTEKEINDFYEKIAFSFLPSSVYQRDERRPNLEIFSMEREGFSVLIPVKERKR